jgi:hypothetical protein
MNLGECLFQHPTPRKKAQIRFTGSSDLASALAQRGENQRSFLGCIPVIKRLNQMPKRHLPLGIFLQFAEKNNRTSKVNVDLIDPL